MPASATGVLREPKRLGTAENVQIYRRHGAGENVHGVSFGELPADLVDGLVAPSPLASYLRSGGSPLSDAACRRRPRAKTAATA